MTLGLPRFAIRRALIYTHRWLGIAGGLLFVAWFVSGIVMMYKRMPSLAPQERLMRLPALDLSELAVSPAEAAQRIGFEPGRLRVSMLGHRPVYRFARGGAWSTVFADDGQPLRGVTAEQALAIARQFAPDFAEHAQYDARLTDSDQWTLQLRGLMPMHRVALGDSDDTRVYISDRTGEVVMKTTRTGRRWAYPGAVLHWLYFTPLRRQTSLWINSVIWLSIAGCILTLSGLLWGIWRYSLKTRYRQKGIRRRSPYAGLMRWHHYAGLIFGLTTFTWILSGCLSLDPWSWHPGTSPTRQQRETMAGGRLRLDPLTPERLRLGAAAISSAFAPGEFEVLQFRGEPFLVAYRPPSAGQAGDWPSSGPAAFLSAVQPIKHLAVSAVAPERGTFELSLYPRQCLGSRRIPNLETLQRETGSWRGRVKRDQVKINWKFDRKASRKNLAAKSTLSVSQNLVGERWSFRMLDPGQIGEGPEKASQLSATRKERLFINQDRTLVAPASHQCRLNMRRMISFRRHSPSGTIRKSSRPDLPNLRFEAFHTSADSRTVFVRGQPSARSPSPPNARTWRPRRAVHKPGPL